MSRLIFAFPILALSAFAEDTALKSDSFEFDLPNLEGVAVCSDDARFDGKVVLVDIWGTWCPPCRKAAPKLTALQDKYRDQGLEIVGIAFEKEDDDAERLKVLSEGVEKMKINYTVLYGGKTGQVAERLPSFDLDGPPPSTGLVRIRILAPGWKRGAHVLARPRAALLP